MTETEKYKLKKPSQDDFYNVDDFNENADIIDAALSANDGRLSDIEAYIGYTAEDIYGVEVDFENNKFTRLAGAVGKTPRADFDNITPWKRKRCILSHDGNVLAYHGDAAYTETGFLEQTVILGLKRQPLDNQLMAFDLIQSSDGAAIKSYPIGTPVNVMVEQQPFYYRVVPLKSERSDTASSGAVGKKVRYYISPEYKPGFVLHPAFRSDTTPLYLSAFENTVYDTSADNYGRGTGALNVDTMKLASVANATPVTSDDITDDMITTDDEKPEYFSAMANIDGEYRFTLLSEYALEATQLLFLIEYASLNSQEHIGVGAETFVTGKTTVLGNGSGMVDNSVSYRGEENIWGCLWYITDKYFNSKYKPGYISAFESAYALDGMGSRHLFCASETNGTNLLPVGDCAFCDNNVHYFNSLRILHGGLNIASSAIKGLSQDAASSALPPVVTGSITFENYGTVKFELYPTVARQSVLNFIYLAQKGHYNGVIVDRLQKDFVIQAGKYQNGYVPRDTDFDYSIKGEFSENGFENNYAFTKGTMAWVCETNDPNSASTEFAIYTDSTTCWSLKGKQAAFGSIVGNDSFSVLAAINEQKTYAEKPIDNIVIASVVIDPVSWTGFEPDFEFPLPNFIYKPNVNGLFATYHYPNAANTPFTARFMFMPGRMGMLV